MTSSAPILQPPADAAALLDKAARCRRLAAASTDRRAADALWGLAAECEAAAAASAPAGVAAA